MDGKQISLPNESEKSFTLKVSVYIPVQDRPQAKDLFNNLYVKNFPSKDFSDEDLRRAFESFGTITSCKVDEASRAFGFVCFEKCESAQAAVDHFSKLENGLKIVKALKKKDRSRELRLKTLRFMKDLARQNLYFKGFPVDGSCSIQELTKELEEYFAKFGPLQTLKLMSRTVEVEGVQKEELLGFGYVSYKTLEGSQRSRFDAAKEPFRGVHKLYVNQFEWKELRQAHRMERIDQIELAQYMKTEQTKKANEVLQSVKEDL